MAIQTRNTAIARIQSRVAAALLLFAGGESIARAPRRREVDRAVRQPASDRILAGSLHFVLACPQGISPAEIDLVELRTPLTAGEARRSSAPQDSASGTLSVAPVGCHTSTRCRRDYQIFTRDHAHARTRLSIAGGCRQTGPATPGPRRCRHRRRGIHRHRGEIIDHDVAGLLRALRSAEAGEPRHRARAAPAARPARRP